jgi:uroporphyrinogen decarboxylase
MTSLERFKTALNFQEPDRVPWTPYLLRAASRVYGISYAEWAQYGDMAARCVMASQEFFGFDVMFAGFDQATEAAGFGQAIIFPDDDLPYPDSDNLLIQTPDDYTRIEPYDPKQDGTRTKELIECCEILMNEKGALYPVVALVNGPLAVLAELRSKEALLSDCETSREAILIGLETVTNTLLEYTKTLAETGATIMFDTSYASQQMMNSKLWLETEGPFMSRLTETVRQAGAMVALNNWGEGPYFDTLIEVMHPQMIATAFLPHDCKDWMETKQHWGSKVALCGAVSSRSIAAGQPEEVKEECRCFLRDMAAGGGYILAPGCEYPPKANLSSVRAMKQAVERYGPYPL